MELFKREKYLSRIRGFYHDTEMIKVISGVRRCGKSSLMKIIIEELQDSGVSNNNIVYFNLDKRPYKSLKDPSKLEQLIDEKTRNIAGIKYLFIDEVQNVKGFEEIINAFREEEDFSIFITGSNSYLLSGELSTKLTGRYLEFQMTTLTFDEYVEMKKFYNKKINSNLDLELISYIQEGGFPYALLLDDISMKKKYVEDVIDEIFSKDIKKNKRIKRKDIFEKIQTYIINNFGSTTSVDHLVDYLNMNETRKVTSVTVYNYLEILENARIISKCKRFDMKSRCSINGGEKYYLTDLSFYFCKNTDNRINYGPVLENIVYNYALSMGYKVSVGRIGKLEVDFIARKGLDEYSYIQVAKTIDNDVYDENGKSVTEEREYKPLEQIKDGYPKYLLTMDHLLQKRSGVKHVNLAKFIVDKKEFI